MIGLGFELGLGLDLHSQSSGGTGFNGCRDKGMITHAYGGNPSKVSIILSLKEFLIPIHISDATIGCYD